ncbi:MAG TPA: hypothetical protein DHW07_05940 [Gammaproteobacteria bacterium]|nr:hypothetical protein [Gammaproteobacteria bacterium]
MIPTAEDFQTQTKFFIPGQKKNSLLVQIEDLLGDFWLLANQDPRVLSAMSSPGGVLSLDDGHSRRTFTRRLISLGVNCSRYLQLKGRRDRSRRTSATGNLLSEVLKALGCHQLAQEYDNGHYSIHEIMDGLYSVWESTGGAERQTALTRWNRLAGRALFAKKLVRFNHPEATNFEVERFLKELDFDAEGVKGEYEGSGNLRTYHPNQMIGEKRVKYFTDEDRQNHLLVFDHADRLWKQRNPDGSETRYSTISPYGGNRDPRNAYAVDADFNLYTHPYTEPGEGEGHIHHSSFLRGERILCAGMIVVINGELRHIDNDSGHYKPHTDNLLNLLTGLLTEHRMNLRSVTTKDKGNPALGFLAEVDCFFNAFDYLLSRGTKYSEHEGMDLYPDPSNTKYLNPNQTNWYGP